jgi:hypothetical protein
MKTSPARMLTGLVSVSLSDIRPDARYGLSPIVPFKLWAEVRCFNPGLGSASGEARLGFRWSLFRQWNLLQTGFACRDSKIASRATSGAKKSGLHRIDRDPQAAYRRLGHRAMGTLGSSCGSRNLFSRQQKPAPELKQRQPETVTEILCEVALRKPCGTRRERRLSFAANPLAKGKFASSRRLLYGAKMGEVS